jgi:hypothetical protein
MKGGSRSNFRFEIKELRLNLPRKTIQDLLGIKVRGKPCPTLSRERRRGTSRTFPGKTKFTKTKRMGFLDVRYP